MRRRRNRIWINILARLVEALLAALLIEAVKEIGPGHSHLDAHNSSQPIMVTNDNYYEKT